MSPAPVCSRVWIEKVEAVHTPMEEDHAAGGDIELDRYRREALERVRALLAGKQLRLRMRHDGLEGFMKDGFYRNAFSGGRSGGVRDRALRIEIESAVLGVDPGAEASERPIYGYLQGSDEAHNELNSYGTVVVVLRSELVEQATVVFGDSIGSTNSGDYPIFAPTPLTDPSLLCTFAHCDLRAASELVSAVDPHFRYAELQIYGGIGQRDIAFIAFCQNDAPGRATIAQLERADIRYSVLPGFQA